MKLLALVVSFFMLVGCATSYQKSGFIGGGYEETQLAENVFRVNFQGNRYTKLPRATDFALLRTAELTLEHGYKYFVLVSESSTVSNSSVTMPYQTQTTGDISGNSFNANSFTTGGPVTISKPSSNNTFMCFKEKPKQFSYDAEFVYKSIRTKYGIKNSNS